MIKYSLIENLLTERTDDYMAQTHIVASYDKDSIIERILQRGTMLTKTDILAVLNAFDETVVEIIKEGGAINLPLFNTGFSINGVFDGVMDSFDTNRHKFNINLSKGTLLRKLQQEVKLEKTDSNPPQPTILEVRDSISGTVNEQLTPKGVIELYGNQIKISGTDPRCGLWFETEGVEPFKSETIIQNKPGTVIAVIPKLVPGKYKVKIVTQNSGHKELKEPKVSVYTKWLTVL